MEEFGGVGGFAFDAEEDVEGGGAGGGRGHALRLYGKRKCGDGEGDGLL
jgi:hypothetical protein